MWPHLILISNDERDLKLAQQVAIIGGFALKQAHGRDDTRRLLVTHTNALVFWDAETHGQYERVEEILPKYIRPHRLFAITDGVLSNYPHLLKKPVFGHHVTRRFPKNAPSIYACLGQAALLAEVKSITDYFPDGAKATKITLKKSSQKLAAIEALQTHLTRQGIRGRLAALVAQATDELIMNAVFDGPVTEKGVPYRHDFPRDSDFNLSEREQVTMEICSTDGYSAVAVTDYFGSLRRRVLLDSLFGASLVIPSIRGNLKVRPKLMEDEQTGLGLRSVMQSGFSLLFRVVPKQQTQTVLFYPEAENFRVFKQGFHFLSLFLD